MHGAQRIRFVPTQHHPSLRQPMNPFQGQNPQAQNPEVFQGQKRENTEAPGSKKVGNIGPRARKKAKNEKVNQQPAGGVSCLPPGQIPPVHNKAVSPLITHGHPYSPVRHYPPGQFQGQVQFNPPQISYRSPRPQQERIFYSHDIIVGSWKFSV
jgi:hypothetical protein